jgi:hypothetical protein
MKPTESKQRRTARPAAVASPLPEQDNADDRLFSAYLAAARVPQAEAESQRTELLEKAREWQAMENIRKVLNESRVEANREEAAKVQAEAAKASTEVAQARWRAFLAARKAKDRLAD